MHVRLQLQLFKKEDLTVILRFPPTPSTAEKEISVILRNSRSGRQILPFSFQCTSSVEVGVPGEHVWLSRVLQLGPSGKEGARPRRGWHVKTC